VARPAELVAAVAYPIEFDASQLAVRLTECLRPVRIVSTPYFEPHDLRVAKARAASDDDVETFRSREPALSEASIEGLARAEALLALDIPIDLAGLAPRLRLLQAAGAGVAQLRPRRLAERGITLTSAAGMSADAIAEFVFARLLQLRKSLRSLDEAQRRHEWQLTVMQPLEGATMVVVGLGAIGTAVAERARAFRMRVLGVRRDPAKGGPSSVEEVLGPGALRDVLARADVVVLAAPETSATERMIDATALSSVRQGAVLVNVARGALVDEDALLASLREGRLAAAILDVTHTEPLPADSPLWDAPNLYLSPHTSAVTEDYGDRLLALYADNLRRYAAGEPLRNVVDPDRGY
jgi:phosphoglycerate dehydrogenase-like enzyme